MAWSPELNPTEKAWARLKQLLCSAMARTTEALEQAIAGALRQITAQNARHGSGLQSQSTALPKRLQGLERRRAAERRDAAFA
jgi:hypothetical protein